MRPHARIWSPELLTKQDLKTDNKRLLKSPHKNSLPTLGKKKIKLSIDTKISRKNNIINSPYLEKNNRQLEGIISPRFLISKRQNKQVVPKMETVSKEKFSEQPNDLNFIRISKRLPSLKEGLTLYDKIFNYESPSKT